MTMSTPPKLEKFRFSTMIWSSRFPIKERVSLTLQSGLILM